MSSRNGYRVFRWTGRATFRVRSHQRFGSKERWYYVERGRFTLLLHWQPWKGIRIAAERLTAEWREVGSYLTKEEYEVAIKKRPTAEGIILQMPGPVPTSTMFGKLSLLREFMSATTYEDGTRRTPGKLFWGSQGRLWELTLKDADALAQLIVREESLDKAFLLLETLLGVEEAPWETDQWAAKKAAEKGKKK